MAKRPTLSRSSLHSGVSRRDISSQVLLAYTSLPAASPHLHDAIVFGAGRPQAGALIILSSFLSSPITKTRDELYQLIRPAIDAANSSAPSHSHLQPEALIYLPHDAEIPRADKGSFIRPKVYKLYEREIEGVYRRLNGEEDDGREKREIGGVEDTQKWLMGLVKGIVKDPSGLEIETDLFDFGLDSLQAGRIRLNIQRVSEEFTGFSKSAC